MTNNPAAAKCKAKEPRICPHHGLALDLENALHKNDFERYYAIRNELEEAYAEAIENERKSFPLGRDRRVATLQHEALVDRDIWQGMENIYAAPSESVVEKATKWVADAANSDRQITLAGIKYSSRTPVELDKLAKGVKVYRVSPSHFSGTITHFDLNDKIVIEGDTDKGTFVNMYATPGETIDSKSFNVWYFGNI